MDAFDEAGWAERLSSVSVSKETMNALVMNYLIVEGHKEAAERFQVEAGVHASRSLLDSIGDRRTLRTSIERGNIPWALALVNPQILSADPQLHFALLQQQLIELIRRNEVEDAVAFAQEELAPLAEQSAVLLTELERTMVLLAYDDPHACQDGSELLSQRQRQRTASLLNAAVLSSQAQEKEAALPMMLRRLQWTQHELQRHTIFPRIDDLEAALPCLSVPTAPFATESDAQA